MAENGSSSREYVLEVPAAPDQRHFIVNFPGYVANEDRALATFDGIEGLATQRATHTKNLQLWLRRDDPYSHPLASDDARSTPTLVLKISRPRNSSAASSPSSLNSEATVEIIAAAECTYSFTSPADFQYVGRDRRPENTRWSDLASSHAQDGPEGIPPQPLLCSPPSFSVEGTTDYSFKQYKAADHGIDSLGRKPKRSSGVTSVDYFAAEVPGALTEPPELRIALQPMAQRLTELLAQRPVYLDAALTHALGALSRSMASSRGDGRDNGDDDGEREIDGINNNDNYNSSGFSGSKGQIEVLSKLCYKFKNGPWKGAWVQRGYDPRQHADACQYQVLDYTLPSDWYRKLARQRQERNTALENEINAHNSSAAAVGSGDAPAAALPVGALAAPPLAKSYAELCAFKGVASTSSTPLQLCDIEDSRVSEALSAPENVDGACNDASGWFCQPAWEGLKARVSARFQSLLDAAAAAGEAAASARTHSRLVSGTTSNNNVKAQQGGAVIASGGSVAAAAPAEVATEILPPGLMAQLMHMLGPSTTKNRVGASAGVDVSLPEEHVSMRVEEEEDGSESDGGGGGESGGDEGESEDEDEEEEGDR